MAGVTGAKIPTANWLWVLGAGNVSAIVPLDIRTA